MVYVFLAQGFEEIEALTPVDVLRRAKVPVATVAVGESLEVTGSHGITVHCDLSEHQVDMEKIDMVVLPGGMPGTMHLEQSQTVQASINYAAQHDRWIGAICAAPSILGHKGLLKGRRATVFPEFAGQLNGAVLSEQEYVCCDGKYITARGMGVALEFSLKLLEKLRGEDAAQEIKAGVQCRR